MISDDYEMEAKKKRREEFAKAALTGLIFRIGNEALIEIAEDKVDISCVVLASWRFADKMIELGDKECPNLKEWPSIEN